MCSQTHQPEMLLTWGLHKGTKCSKVLIVESKAVGTQVDTTNVFQLCSIFLFFHDKLLLNKSKITKEYFAHANCKPDSQPQWEMHLGGPSAEKYTHACSFSPQVSAGDRALSGGRRGSVVAKARGLQRVST